MDLTTSFLANLVSLLFAPRERVSMHSSVNAIIQKYDLDCGINLSFSKRG